MVQSKTVQNRENVVKREDFGKDKTVQKKFARIGNLQVLSIASKFFTELLSKPNEFKFPK